MTDLMTPPAPVTEADLQAKGGWRRTKNAIMTGLMGVAFVTVMVPLGFVLWTVISKGIGILSWEFLTSEIPISSRDKGGGMAPAIVGTLIMTGFATLLAVPLGILGAVYLHEYGKTSPMARFVRFMSYVMTGVPSIVMGLFIYTVWTLRFGLEGIGGALALACLMLPVVIRTTEEMLKLVPDYLREAAYALGTRKSRTVLTVVLPAALPGITSGSLLAVARAAGETAPLLFTIGYVTKANWNLFSGPNTSLSAQIFSNATSPYVGAQERAWGAALVLVLIAFLFTLFSRIIAARFATQR